MFLSPDTERAASGQNVQRPPVPLCGGILAEDGRQRYNIAEMDYVQADMDIYEYFKAQGVKIENPPELQAIVPN